jgi:hypothetical protein
MANSFKCPSKFTPRAIGKIKESAKQGIDGKEIDDESALHVSLPQEVIRELVIEAALRGMGLVELIAQILCEAVKKDMVGTILDGEVGWWRSRRTASVH